MTSTTSISAILVATLAAPAFAQDELPFTPGEGPFTWDSLSEFAAAHDYSGQQVTIA